MAGCYHYKPQPLLPPVLEQQYRSRSLTEAGLSHYETFSPKFDWLSKEYLVNYMQIKNKWTVQNIWRQSVGYDKILNDTVIVVTEFVTTAVDTLNTTPFLYGDRLQYGDVFVYRQII